MSSCKSSITAWWVLQAIDGKYFVQPYICPNSSLMLHREDDTTWSVGFCVSAYSSILLSFNFALLVISEIIVRRLTNIIG